MGGVVAMWMRSRVWHERWEWVSGSADEQTFGPSTLKSRSGIQLDSADGKLIFVRSIDGFAGHRPGFNHYQVGFNNFAESGDRLGWVGTADVERTLCRTRVCDQADAIGRVLPG
jgi:hypothetical protein